MKERFFMADVYFAAPLFAQSEQLYNAHLVKELRRAFPTKTFYLPQEAAEINDKNNYADAKQIAQYDTEQLLQSQLMIAVLDGPVIDVGVASEIGVAYQAQIPIVGLFTDSRQQGASNSQKLKALGEIAESQFPYANLYTIGLVKLNGAIVNNEEDLLTSVAKYL